MTNEENTEMIKSRINADVIHFEGSLPERYALAWHGYLAGAFECGGIEIQSYSYLVDLLPKIKDPNPILEIFDGRDIEEE